jgi:hypothetical protein
MGERSAAAAHDGGLSGHVNHVAGRGIGIGARLAMGVIAVAAVTQAGATSAPDADAILQRAFDNYRAGSSATSVAMTVHRPDWERHLDLKAWTRGQDDALVRFVARAAKRFRHSAEAKVSLLETLFSESSYFSGISARSAR